MPITIRCPNPTCGKSANVSDSFVGRSVKCKTCGTPFKAIATLDGQPAETKASSPSSPGDPFPKLPVEFGRYRVLKLLGRGGMGAVYLAEDSQLGRQVALKLPNFDASETKRVERFVREARAAAGLMHPNICPVYDAGQINGRPFITMAFIPGEPLESAIDPDQPMDQRRAAEIVRKVALALQEAHEKGIVHRDLKPANVMLTAKGEPVVMDFGLAKRISETDANEAKLTQQGVMMGTPSYMAPEQVKGELESIGPATDVYSLGVILFEMLSGRVPYQGPLAMVLSQILLADPPPVEEFRPDVDPRLAAICRNAMAKPPSARFASMAAFAESLVEYLTPTLTSVSLVEMPAARTVVPTNTVPAEPVNAFAAMDESESKPAKRTRRTIPQKAARPEKPAKSNRMVWIGAALAGVLAVVATIIVTVKTPHGDVVIELSDPNAKVEVKLDGTIKLPSLDKPISMTVGEHNLTVTGEDFETVTQQFTVKKAGTPIVKVKLIPIAKPVPPTPDPGVPMTPQQPNPMTPMVVAPPVATPTPANEFVSLFNGRDLTGWVAESGDAANWKVENGAIAIDGGETIRTESWLLTEKSYKDFIAKFEFKSESGTSNTGFAYRCVPGERPLVGANNAPYSVPTHLQIEIFSAQTLTDRVRPLVTGTLLGSLNPQIALKGDPFGKQKPDGEWNEMEVEARGQTLKVRLNGGSILDGNLDDLIKQGGRYPGLRRTEGRIGFQRLRGAAKFRNIRIQELAPTVPAGATALGTSSYKVYSDNLTWKQAKAKCVELGGRLATVTSDSQNRLLSRLIDGANLDEAWIGATDEADEGKWVWIDGTPLTYANWGNLQPNNKMNAEHFALIYLGPNRADKDNGKWSDQPNVSTQHKPGFVCEWPVVAANAEPGFVPLFNGKDLTGWTGGGRAVGEALEIVPGAGNVRTAAEYGPDIQLKAEFWLPLEAGKQGQARANSGIFLLDRYEIQILDSKGFDIEPKQACGALYNQIGPTSKAGLPPEQWQTLDVTFHAPLPTRKGEITVILNGLTVIDRATVERPTAGAVNAQLATRGPIALQDHNSRVRFRNLRIKALPASVAAELVPLLNGKDLAGWTPLGDPNWSWANGRILGAPAVKGRAGFLVTEADYDDFELELQYRLGEGAGSGLFLRTDPTGPTSGAKQLEVQIIDDDSFPQVQANGKTGSVYGVFARKLDPPIKRGDWNAMRVRLQKRQLQVWVNGAQTIDADLDSAAAREKYAERPGLTRTTGRIGLQQNQPATVEFRDIRIKPLPAVRAVTERASPTLTVLAELPNGPDKSGPWVSPDGLTLYWAEKPKGDFSLWRAGRKSPGDRFEGATRIGGGYDLTLSNDLCELIYADKGSDDKHRLYVRGKTSASDPQFSAPRTIAEFDSLGYLCAPCLSDDGLTLYAERLDPAAKQSNVFFRRAAKGRPWGPPEDLVLFSLPGKGNLRFPYVTADGKYLFGTCDWSPSGMVVLSRDDDGKSYGKPKVIELPPGGPSKGIFPRYVAATGELFFSTNEAGFGKSICMLRNFDPVNCIRPIN